MTVKIDIFKKTPISIQNTAITVFNTYQYRMRHGGVYKKFRNYYKKADQFNTESLHNEIENRKSDFFTYIKRNSKWYKSYNFNKLDDNPILEKKDIINNLDSIKTVNEKNGVISLTGGTTGASMKVIYTKEDIQERFAIIDHFRLKHGYKLGKKTAWFSGKNLISDKDISRGICSHYDFINKIRFYSTFKINKKNFQVYWNSLNKFKPEFIVGFPSSVYEICEIADSMGLKLDHKVKVFFPTAETVLPKHREVIGKVLGCKLVDQYASSEGAPFILECEAGNLHTHPLTGIFEVVDENLKPSDEGELLITSFTTKGTPLVRYRIGDSIKLSRKDKKCSCGSLFPLVDRIEGRSTDYLLSPSYGKVNLGNLSNSTKDIKGIIKFQAIQNTIDNIKVLIVANEQFSTSEKIKFKAALAERFGPKVNLVLDIVEDIPNEASGKFRIIKNNLKR